MHQREDRTEGELPLEAEADVQQDAAQRQEHAEAALVAQFFTHLRADVLDPLQVRRVAGIGLLQGGSDLLAQFRVLAGHPHQHVAGVAEALHHGVLVAGADQLTTHLAEIGRLFVGQLDQRTAGEVEAEVDALGEPAAQGDDGQDQGAGKRDVADAHEVDGTDLDIHLSPLRSTAS